MSKTKRYESIILNEKSFKLDHKLIIPYPVNFRARGVNDVYSKPSETKRAIWVEWSNWFYDNQGFCTVASYNSNFFTIEGKVTDKLTGKKYWCYITHANNYCYEMV